MTHKLLPEWTEVRPNIPPEEVVGIPDETTVWVAWQADDGRHVTVYKADADEAYVLEGRHDEFQVTAGPITLELAMEVAETARRAVDRRLFERWCETAGGRFDEQRDGCRCEVAGSEIFDTAGELVAEYRENPVGRDKPMITVSSSPEVGIGRYVDITAPVDDWSVEQTVDDGNLYTSLSVEKAEVEVHLGVWGPAARLTSQGIELVD